MRVRPVHISFLKETRKALSYRHCSFHIFNRPQPSRVLKYFMRLVAIGFAYGEAEGSHRILTMAGRRERIVIPIHGNQPLKSGLLRSLMKIAGLQEDDL
jgi:predicted RNA binding protein YcfA (HicA-like mRNA interferase family)